MESKRKAVEWILKNKLSSTSDTTISRHITKVLNKDEDYCNYYWKSCLNE